MAQDNDSGSLPLALRLVPATTPTAGNTRPLSLHYNLHKSIGGLCAPGINLRVTPSGWEGMHYVIEENLVTGKVEFQHLTTDSLLQHLRNLGPLGGLGEMSLANYFGSPVAAAFC